MKNTEEEHTNQVQDELDFDSPEDMGTGCCQDNIKNVPWGTDTLEG